MKNYTSTRAIVGMHFIRLDFLQYYRYCQRWVDLFEKQSGYVTGRNRQLYKRNAQPDGSTF